MEKDYGLDKKQILVVEDDFVLAREMCNKLSAHGAAIVGPAPTVHYARLIIGKRQLDGAVLDIKLFGEDVYGLADDLLREGVPLLFATAYRNEQVEKKYGAVDTLHKPIDLEQLVERVSAFKREPANAHPRSTTLAGDGQNRTFFKQPAPTRESVFDKWSRALARTMRERG